MKQEAPAQQPWEVGFTNRVVKSWGRALPRCRAAEGIKGIERNEGRGLLTCGYYQTARVAYANCPCAIFGF
jgi:hypothetical protein